MLFGAYTDAGLIREDNEDSYYLDGNMLIIADGMGGHNAGEVASSLAVDSIVKSMTNFSSLPDSLVEAVQIANNVVFKAAEDADLQGMGTTLTCAVFKDGSVYVAHVGDSRAYLFRDEALLLLSADHTVVEELIRFGSLSKDEAKAHPLRHMLTRALGTSPSLEVDLHVRQLRDDDIILLCTDGLTSVVDEVELIDVLKNCTIPQVTAEQLVQLANVRGGPDNTTVLLARVGC